MRTAVRLTAYVAGLLAVFGAAAGAGAAIGPDNSSPAAAPAPAHTGAGTHSEPAPGAHSEPATEAHSEPATEAHGADSGGGHDDATPAGLQSVQDGYRLSPVSTELSTTAARPFEFRILDEQGRPVTDYTVSHEKELHLIVVRRDLAHYQHVHPTRKADGTWTVPLRAGAPGQYRVFADFETAGHQLTLGVDVPAPGDYRPVPLPHPARTAEVDGYTVTLDGDLANPAFTVRRQNAEVTPEPYLGARGHLVVLREGDLAYLHVHPSDPESLAFKAEVPSGGVYRLYLDFQHDGKVHTAEFTADTGHTHS
ncbi:hypothetical protein [Actinoplanes sp. DH11]|uniref:hypothetical protein n=1 Tax=Actinoplanes sp. DH11 TaxID=2857011 RepID=UPI001E597767|nr:hypothetical protein [Actinoplanes sp. DH11]